jgi:hypothetical protein
MNPEIKRRWIEALRSGEYEQGTYSLRSMKGDKVTYCCLGVLCDLYAKEKGTKWYMLSNEYFTFMSLRSELPQKVMKWAGIKRYDGEFSYKNGKDTSLMGLNDDGKSFKQIADVIEKYF